MVELPGIKVCVFDAYGTLFDVNAAAAHLAPELDGKAERLSEIWRLKQLQYSWLRSMMGDAYIDFWEVTGDALDFAMESLGLDDQEMRQRLMDLYFELDCYPEVPSVLARLRAAGLKTAILSNGSPAMLEGAVASAGIGDSLDAVLSVDTLGFYKPRPEVYTMVTDTFGIDRQAVCFMSSNGWDAYAAKHFGFRVCWVNRFGQPDEKLPRSPDFRIATLDDVVPILGV